MLRATICYNVTLTAAWAIFFTEAALNHEKAYVGRQVF